MSGPVEIPTRASGIQAFTRAIRAGGEPIDPERRRELIAMLEAILDRDVDPCYPTMKSRAAEEALDALREAQARNPAM